MSVVRHKFDMLVIDDERVMIMPVKGAGYELPKEETNCALRFLGFQPNAPHIQAPARVVQLARPLNDAAPVLTRNQHTVLRILGDSVDQMTVQTIGNASGIKLSTVSGSLYRLEALRLVGRVRPASLAEPHLWQITTTGIDVLADA